MHLKAVILYGQIKFKLLCFHVTLIFMIQIPHNGKFNNFHTIHFELPCILIHIKNKTVNLQM